MKRWLLIVLLAAALGAAGHDGWAGQERRGHRAQPSRHTQHGHPAHLRQQHRHRHGHVRSFTGIVVVPALVPRYYYAPVPYPYYPLYVAPPAAGAPQSYAPPPAEYQYFCPDNRLYYPAVLECPSGWLAVVPGVGGPPPVPRD